MRNSTLPIEQKISRDFLILNTVVINCMLVVKAIVIFFIPVYSNLSAKQYTVDRPCYCFKKVGDFFMVF